MNDNQIVDLYWTRSEKAIEETEHKLISKIKELEIRMNEKSSSLTQKKTGKK